MVTKDESTLGVRAGRSLGPGAPEVAVNGVFQLLAGTALGDVHATRRFGQWLLGLPVRATDPDDVRQRVAIRFLAGAEDVFYRMVRRGPSWQQALTPADAADLEPEALADLDRRLVACVRSALANQVKSDLRKPMARRLVALDPEAFACFTSPEPGPLDALEAQASAGALQELEGELSGASLQDIEQMEALQDRELDMDTLVRADLAERGLEATEATRRASRDRIYKRHERTRQRVERSVEALVRAGRIPDVHRDKLIAWIQSLRRRILHPASADPGGRRARGPDGDRRRRPR